MKKIFDSKFEAEKKMIIDHSFSNPAYYLAWNVGRYTTATNINKVEVAGEESVENMEIFHALCARAAILPITIFAI
jgi:hypothetical protein